MATLTAPAPAGTLGPALTNLAEALATLAESHPLEVGNARPRIAAALEWAGIRETDLLTPGARRTLAEEVEASRKANEARRKAEAEENRREPDGTVAGRELQKHIGTLGSYRDRLAAALSLGERQEHAARKAGNTGRADRLAAEVADARRQLAAVNRQISAAEKLQRDYQKLASEQAERRKAAEAEFSKRVRAERAAAGIERN